MELEKLAELATFSSSEYELRYVTYASIGYDRATLGGFLQSLIHWRKEPQTTECKILEAIWADQDQEFIERWLRGDPHADRMANIEKWARQAAGEMLLDGKYSLDTFLVISQFPLADYGLVVKRVQELVHLVADVTTQSERPGAGMPGQ
jgi:hypothetical protein